MNSVRIFGLILFLTGFFIFNASFFWADFRLTTSIVDEKISDTTKREIFLSKASSLLNQTLGSNFHFVNELTNIFESVNSSLVEKFKISDAEIQDLTERTHSTFSLSNVDSVFRTSNEAASFKNQAFRDFISSLDGQ